MPGGPRQCPGGTTGGRTGGGPLAAGHGRGHNAPMSDKPPRRPRTLFLAALAAVVLVAIAGIAIALSRGEPELLDASTPEGVVQRYAAAVLAGDEEEGLQYLSPGASKGCTAPRGVPQPDLRMTLASSDVRELSADVRVVFTATGRDGPFGMSEFESSGVFDLVRSGEGWLIDSVPWELDVCLEAKELP